MTRLITLLRKKNGQAMLEMALVLPILLMLIMGIFEFSRILGSYMLITNLSREGARYGVVGHDDSQIQSLVLSRKAWLNEDDCSIIINPSYQERDKGDALSVQVDYAIELMTPIIADILPNPVLLSAACTMRVE